MRIIILVIFLCLILSSGLALQERGEISVNETSDRAKIVNIQDDRVTTEIESDRLIWSETGDWDSIENVVSDSGNLVSPIYQNDTPQLEDEGDWIESSVYVESIGENPATITVIDENKNRSIVGLGRSSSFVRLNSSLGVVGTGGENVTRITLKDYEIGETINWTGPDPIKVGLFPEEDYHLYDVERDQIFDIPPVEPERDQLLVQMRSTPGQINRVQVRRGTTARVSGVVADPIITDQFELKKESILELPSDNIQKINNTKNESVTVTLETRHDWIGFDRSLKNSTSLQIAPEGSSRPQLWVNGSRSLDQNAQITMIHDGNSTQYAIKIRSTKEETTPGLISDDLSLPLIGSIPIWIPLALVMMMVVIGGPVAWQSLKDDETENVWY